MDRPDSIDWSSPPSAASNTLVQSHDNVPLRSQNYTLGNQCVPMDMRVTYRSLMH